METQAITSVAHKLQNASQGANGNAEEGFFGESGSAAADLPNGFSQEETALQQPGDQTAEGEPHGEWGAGTSEGFETGYAEDIANAQELQQHQQENGLGQAEAEQTYGGGYTHQQVT